ncbi:MAG: GTPase HflX [Parachlamydiales bacterium]|nr:GTPase HflX [Parachlamydiales bacterium]
MLEKEHKDTNAQEQKLALLIGTYQGSDNKEICEEHLNELEQLADGLGIETLQKMACTLRKIDVSTYLGSGKIEELAEMAKSIGANVVIFDEEMLPSQQRNLEKAFGIPVIDRTEVILEVFAQRAQTKEARLQIELAQVKYQYPRLKRLWTHLSRQRGGGVNQKGEGETQIEIDRRLLKKRVEKLQSDLNKIQEQREVRRSLRDRREIPTFAIVGYTNAGKSTLLKALTNADVLVEDKLFATLDTTTRKFTLPNNQEILLIDTVGFVRKLPHTLVAAFRSTLEEAFQADILLHLIDISHPMAEEQAQATFDVLKELKVEDKPIITVLNKEDKLVEKQLIQKMRIKYPKTVAISSLTHEGFPQLMDLMQDEIIKRRRSFLLRIPQSDFSTISEIIRLGKVHRQDYDENDIVLQVDVPPQLFAKVQPYVVEE